MGSTRGTSRRLQLVATAVVLLVLCTLTLGPVVVDAQLQHGYYEALGCRGVEDRVRALVRVSFLADPRASSAMLRLAFHDCQVGPGGCDGSIMIEGSGREMESGNNFGVKRLDIINSLKAAMERVCPNTVSCADIIAMVGRDAVAFNGGPEIRIPLGRKDAEFSSAAEANAKLPPATSTVDRILNVFGSFGMSVAESVAILGSHSVGVGHCRSIQDRLLPNSASAPNNLVFRSQLRTLCAVDVADTVVIPNDLSLIVFDNQYFKDLLNGRGLFTSDAVMSTDPRTAPTVALYAANRAAFFSNFQSAYVKLTARALTGNQGSVRSTCQL